ncbi:MAG TPA: hypothetical protein PL025_03135, partial [Anaerolineaceae bacterium]|nr:hypothetical protein [Anaerolineaceae bacterium]
MKNSNLPNAGSVLQEWRTKILNWVLAVLSVTLVPTIISMYLREVAGPSQWYYIYALTAIGAV